MKVGFELNNFNKYRNPGISFQGYNFVKTNTGKKQFQVSYPFDSEKQNCYLEVYTVDKDPQGNYFTVDRAYTIDGNERIPLTNESNTIDIAKTFGIPEREPFAYHFIVENKEGKKERHVRVDAGDVIDERNGWDKHKLFNIVEPDKSNVSRGGSMKLVIIDSQKVGHVYNLRNEIAVNQKVLNRAKNGIKSITNKFGGTLAGLEKSIEDGEFDSYGRIISLPMFTDDDFSGHAYWNENCYQMANGFGNIHNYRTFQQKMFAHDLKLVSDGAFVNEGLQGVHFKHLAKWGEDSPYKYWFKARGLQDGPLNYGVFAKNKDFISHKVINAPWNYSQDFDGIVKFKENKDYNPKQPTYVQIYDNRLVNDDEKYGPSLIKTYSQMNTDNPYDLHSHNDSVFLYSFEIEPEFYHKNVLEFNEFNKIKAKAGIPMKLYDSAEAARICTKSRHYVLNGKFEGGFDTWDANPDIAKLNFVFSNTDNKYLRNFTPDNRDKETDLILRGNYQVQDYIIDSGKYWTRKTNDIHRLYVAQALRDVDKDNPELTYNYILKLANGKVLPKSLNTLISKDDVKNVIKGHYNLPKHVDTVDKNSLILQGLMNTPLDSIEFGDNIVSVLASPLISKRASRKEDIGVSRYDLYKAGDENLPLEYSETYQKMNKIYTDEMFNFALDALNTANKFLPEDKKLFKGEKVTEFGEYVIPLLTPEIAKFAMVKALAPNNLIQIDPKSGEIIYSYNNLKNVHLQTLGIRPLSLEDESLKLLDKIEKGISKLDINQRDNVVQSILNTLHNTTLESFRLSDYIIDKTQAGLDWRIDATKDIADIEALRIGHSSFNSTWREVTDFWKAFNKGIIEENPNAYIVAEVTDENDLYNNGYGSYSDKFKTTDDILRKFKRDTGITAIADYSFFFSKISNIFSKSFETGKKAGDNDTYIQSIVNELLVGSDNQSPLARAGSPESLKYAYTFIGNHDKPRALHCAAMDMELFYTDLTYESNYENRKKAIQILEDKFLEPISDYEIKYYDFSGVSPKAVAMADAIRPAFVNILNKYRKGNVFSSEDEFNKKAFIPISKAVCDLANGRYLGGQFNPEAFGVKPIDVAVSAVLKQAREVYGLSIPGISDKKFGDEVFENIMTPAIHRLLGMMKYLVALPGIPTLFDGDDAGATGYDTKTKNMFLQGRQRIHEEWFEDANNENYKQFIAKYRDEFNKVMGIRKRPECSALNEGGIYPLPLQYSQDGTTVPAVLRQSPDGKMAISLFNTSGLHYSNLGDYKPNKIYVDKIYLGESGDIIGVPGLNHDMKFVNANDETDVYYPQLENGAYYLSRVYGNKKVPTPIEDSTLILYYVPKTKPLAHTGEDRVKPPASLVTDAYKKAAV